MTQQTALEGWDCALNKCVATILSMWQDLYYNGRPTPLDSVTYAVLKFSGEPEYLPEALQDPRYLAYCKEQDRKPPGTSSPEFGGVIIKPGEGRSWHGSVEIVNPPTTEQDRKEQNPLAPDWFKKYIPALEEARLHDAWNGPLGKEFRDENDLGDMEYPEYLKLINAQKTPSQEQGR